MKKCYAIVRTFGADTDLKVRDNIPHLYTNHNNGEIQFELDSFLKDPNFFTAVCTLYLACIYNGHLRLQQTNTQNFCH